MSNNSFLIVIINFLALSDASISFLPGCCTTQDECNQWMDTWKSYNSSRNTWFHLVSDQRQHGSSCSSRSVDILIDANGFTSGHLENDTLSILGSNENDEHFQIQFSSNSSIRVSNSNFEQQSLSEVILGDFPQDSYCIRKTDTQFIKVELCLSKHRWYQKCCPVGQGFNFSYGCVDLNHNKSHIKFPPTISTNKIEEETQKLNYPVVTYPSCSYPTIISSALAKLDYVPTPWKILGSNRIAYYDRKLHVPHWKTVTENYCVDQLVLSRESIDIDTCGGGEQDVLIFCESEDNAKRSTDNESEESRYIFSYTNIIALGVSMCFLAATALGFIVLEKQNIHKKSMLFYVLSQFMFYFFILVIYVDQLWKILSTSWCVPVGILAHFFGLSTFTWLLVINFDLWWTFRVLNPSTDVHWSRLAIYGIIATAIPFMVIAVAISLQHLSNETPIMCRRDKEPSFTVPGYGTEHCFLSDGAQLVYFYTPVGILLLTNVIFYSCTSYRLCKLNVKRKGHSAKKHRSSCQLLLKLFCVMGTVWILQVIHALVDLHERTWYWSIVDVGSMLQSIAIFVIFICKRDNWRTLTKKYPILQGMFCTRGMEVIPDTTTPDGSTRLSRTEGPQRKSGVPEFQQPSEIIQLPFHNSS